MSDFSKAKPINIKRQFYGGKCHQTELLLKLHITLANIISAPSHTVVSFYLRHTLTEEEWNKLHFDS